MSDLSTNVVVRLGTRGSMLARMQSQLVADELQKHHKGLQVELVVCTTSADKIADRPLHEAGGKGLFTKELEEALLARTIDFAVHSFKDMPVTIPPVDNRRLVIAAVPTREDVRDALASSKARSLRDLPPGAVVGTGSLRRRCQVLSIRPDLRVEPIRGNIETRLRKMRDGQYDAVILAMAGLRRSGLFDDAEMTPIDVDEMLPAAAQGALAIQCRREDGNIIKMLSLLNDPIASMRVELERSLAQALNGDCHSPIAALATVEKGEIHLRAAVGCRGSEPPVVRAQASATASTKAVLDEVVDSLEKQGVRRMLAGAQS